jgi:hypothetical protein
MALKQKIENGSVYQLNPFAGTWKKIGKAPERYSNKKFEGKVFEGKDLPIDVAPERKVAGQIYLPEMSTIAGSIESAVGGAIMKGGKAVSDAFINAGQRATAPAFKSAEQAVKNLPTSAPSDQPSPYGEITAPKGGPNYYARSLMSNVYNTGQQLVNEAFPPAATPQQDVPQPMPPSDQGPSLQDIKNRSQARSADTANSLYNLRLANDQAKYMQSKFDREKADLEAMHQKNVAQELEYNRQKNAFPWESKSAGIVVEKPRTPMSTQEFKGLSLDKQIARAGIPLSPEQSAASVASGRAKIEAEFPTSTAPAMTQGNTPSQPASSPKYDYTEFEKRKAFAQSGKGRVVNEDNIDSLIM